MVVLAAGCGTLPIAEVQEAPAASSIETTLYLIGDAGVPDEEGEPVFEALTEDIAGLPPGTRPLTVFLGDNIYPRGMPPPDAPNRADAERRLAAQIAVAVATETDAIFVPGNHDWDFAGTPDRERVVQAAQFGESIGQGRVRFLPAGTCPGPETVDVGTHVRLILLDTQWWLFSDPFGGIPETCPTHNRREVLDSLRAAIASAGSRHVIVAGHHPLASSGVHGGYFTFGQHLFPLREKYRWAWIPLPGLGSAYPIARRLGISDQDISGPRYTRMRAAFDSVFTERTPLVFAGGHEHTLQVIADESPRFHIVSGAGNYGHISPVGRESGTLFAAASSGYVRLDFQSDGRVRLGVIVVDARAARNEAYSLYLQ